MGRDPYAAGHLADAERDGEVNIWQVDTFDLAKLGTSLHDKLATAQRMLVSGKVKQACENLDSFLGEVKAQTGKGPTLDRARSLTDGAREAKDVIGC